MPKAEKAAESGHSLIIHNRKHLVATGISDVDGMDDKTVSAAMPERLLIIRGKDLKVTRFSAETGELELEGEIDSVTYSAALSRKAGFLKRLLK